MENKRQRRQPTEDHIRAAESIRRATNRSGEAAPDRSFNVLNGMDISPGKRDPELEVNKRINERLQQPGVSIPNTNDDYTAQGEKMSADDIIRASEERLRQSLLDDDSVVREGELRNAGIGNRGMRDDSVVREGELRNAGIGNRGMRDDSVVREGELREEDERREIRMRLLQEAAKTGTIPNYLKKY